MNNIGVVVIGRNEGLRLQRCLESIVGVTKRVVYVDSGSTDGSVARVKKMGLETVELDMQIPFTAARARNAGFTRLQEYAPDVAFIQFVDGDCEVVGGWLESAAEFLRMNLSVALVCGRLRERYPERSVYNMLCDSEWDTVTGETKACGGNFMARAGAFAASGGFNDRLIAGEESELCLRLRAAGWKVWRMDTEMALHDAAMTRFRQWWKRSSRTGYAYAEGAYLYGNSNERHRITESRRIWLWGVLIPAISLGLYGLVGWWACLTLGIYPLQVMRIALKGNRSVKENWLRAYFIVLGKFPEALGLIKFQYNRLLQRQAKLIEYK